MLRWLFLPICLTALLQAQINTPRIGFIRCGDGSLRPVYGLPAAFILGAPAAKAVAAASFSDFGGLISVGRTIELIAPNGALVSEFEAQDPFALVNIDGALSTAIAWLPTARAILHWDGKLFLKTNVQDPPVGKVTAIRLAGSTAKLLVLEDKSVSEATIALDSGNLLSSQFLPGIESPAFWQHGSVLFQSDRQIRIEDANGTFRTVALDLSGLRIERMASEWLHLTASGTSRHWALHITDKTLQLSELPVPSMKLARSSEVSK